MRLVIFFIPILFLFVACDLEKPEGQFECTGDDDCPSNWFCDTDMYCYNSTDTEQDEPEDTGTETDTDTDTDTQ